MLERHSTYRDHRGRLVSIRADQKIALLPYVLEYSTKPRSSDPPPKNIALDYRAFRIAGHDRQFAHVRCRKGVAVVDQHYENGKRVASDT